MIASRVGHPNGREEGGHGGWLLAPERRAVFGPVRVAFAR
jgi:hypothetical protein